MQTHVQTETPSSVTSTTITLFRTYVSSDTKIPVEEMQERLAEEGLDIPVTPRTSTKDAFRIGIRDIFNGRTGYRTPSGTEYKILITEARAAVEDVRLEVHVRSADKHVNYSDRLCSFWLRGNDTGFTPESEQCWPTLNRLGITEVNPQRALDDGHNCLFENDVRNLLKAHLVEHTVSGWTGVHFAYNRKALERIEAFERALSFLPRGKVNLSALTLENTPRNLSQIVDDLKESFRERLSALLDRLNKPGPNIQRIEREFNILCNTHEQLEEELDQAIDLDRSLQAVLHTLAIRKREADAE